MASLAVRGAFVSVAPCRFLLPAAGFKQPISVAWRSQIARKQQQRARDVGGRRPSLAAAAMPTGNGRADPEKVPIADIIKSFLSWSPLFTDRIEYKWTEDAAFMLLGHLLGATIPQSGSTHEVLPCSLGNMLLVPSGVDTSAQSKVPCLHLMDGEQRILTLCLLLAAARSRLLGAGDSACGQLAQKVERLLQIGGSTKTDTAELIHELDLQDDLPEQLQVALAGGQGAVFLRRLLLEPACQSGDAELAVESRRNLYTNLQLFRRKLGGMELSKVQLLAQLVLHGTTATIHDDMDRYSTDYRVPACALSFWLPQEHLPINLRTLAYSADLIVSLDGCAIPLALHSSMLAAGSKVLDQALAAHAGDSAAQVTAVEQAFAGHPLPDVKVFLRLLYSIAITALRVRESGARVTDQQWGTFLGGSSWLVARGVAEADAFAGVVVLAHELDARTVLQICQMRLVELLDSASAAEWASWLPLADRCGLSVLKTEAAKRCANSAESSSGSV
ncbi:hypothetical protein ABPG75_000095 [Micractinium tetrahymenae]